MSVSTDFDLDSFDGRYRGPFPGQQTKFVERTEREVFFGGAGGGGKSVNGMGKFGQQLAVEHRRYEDGQITNSKAWGLYLRRTMPDLRQAIDRSHQIFTDIDPDATYNVNDHIWTFPSCANAHFQFGHMESEASKYKYKSSEFTYCVARGTRVRMAAGALTVHRPIENIEPGDLVMTLAGPRRVTHVHRAGLKPCVSVVVRDASGRMIGDQTHPVDHPILTIGEARLQLSGACSENDPPSPRECGSWRSYEHLLADHQEPAGTSSWSVAPGTDFSTFGDSPREALPPPGLSVRVVLVSQQQDRAQAPAVHAPFRETDDSSRTDFLADCVSERGQGDEQLQFPSDTFQGHPPSPIDAATRSRENSTQDDHRPFPTRTPTWRDTWVHPYTRAERDVCVDVAWGMSVVCPIEDRECFDLTVEDANHYITECGLVNRNCFLDELTEFTETMYEYIDTRIRTSDPVLAEMLQLCSASNPDGPGLLWVRKRFIEGKTPEVTYRKQFRLRDGRIKNYDSVFIPARLEDNPVLLAQGSYEASLLNKRPEVREAILNGNWYVNAGAFLANIWDSALHVCPNHDIPKNAFKFRMCDPGLTAPSSVMWAYVDREECITIFHALNVRNHDAPMLAGRIREIEQYYGLWDDEANESMLNGPIDEDAFSRNLAGGPSYAKLMRDCGIRWVRSNKDRFNGTAEVVRRLNARVKPIKKPGEEAPPLPDRPMLRFMERCKSPIETLPILQADPNDPNDVDTKGNDHDWDAVRYGCMYRRLFGGKEQTDDDDDNIVDISQYRKRGNGGSGGPMGTPPGGW